MAASAPLSATTVGVEDVADIEVLEMEYLFEKLLMPSDMCGSTEWLGIPEEHAWKLGRMVQDQDGYFTVFVEDGVVPGKQWHFRYWGNKKIHGLTKGWRCFVSEKGLKAGDTVSFFRGAVCSRLFICYRSGARANLCSFATSPHGLSAPLGQARPRAVNEVGGRGQRRQTSSGRSGALPLPLPVSSRRRHRTSVVRPIPEPMTEMPPILESMFLVATPPAVKTIRLFGVDIKVPLPSIVQPKRESNP
ncbi:B3 domain-containing protein Os02g0455800-like [Oryza brachyantha]|uniref:TF-B3 domain-containing protein n=1 Tax=Oryza brachyantha TaxID=4533 RepID=J3MSM5_ORYBR|nr:B3 domain-containing protein Os02g0455800-like [Oryza brachyantha]